MLQRILLAFEVGPNQLTAYGSAARQIRLLSGVHKWGGYRDVFGGPLTSPECKPQMK